MISINKSENNIINFLKEETPKLIEACNNVLPIKIPEADLPGKTSKKLMQVKKNIQKKIDLYAQKRLSHLKARTFPFEIINCIDDFKGDLSDNNIIIEDIEDKQITHSSKISMDLDPYLQIKNILEFVSLYLGTEYCYVKNNMSGDGVIFIGHINNIYATQVLFDCIKKIALEIRQIYINKLKPYKKESTKNKRADEYMHEWFEELIENHKNNIWYDPSSRKYFSDYVEKNFKIIKDERQIMLRAIEIIQSIYNKNDGSISFGKMFKTFSKKYVKETLDELNEFRLKDIVITFSGAESKGNVMF